MRDFVFITDVHLKGQSKVRSGNVCDDICRKLQFVVDYCNKNQCDLLIGGDFFDTPTVADVYKAPVVSVLSSLKTDCYNIPGNHCELYGNSEYNYKTSFNLFTKAGLWKNLDDCPFIDLGNVILTSHVPITTKGKPQIVMFHGFLNQDDGKCTFRFTDLDTTDNTVVLLGHDHCVYDDLRYKDNIKIIRPGSLLRGERTDESDRIPQLVHLKLKDGKILTKKVPIDCRDSKEIFKTKVLDITKSQQKDTYDFIINQIRNAQKSDLSFKDALSQVAELDVVNFCMNLLENYNQEEQFKKQNL